MKKIFLLILLLSGLYPVIEDNGLALKSTHAAKAERWSTETNAGWAQAFDNLSEVFGFDITGAHYNSDGDLVFDLSDGSIFNINHGQLDEVVVQGHITHTIHEIVNDFPTFTSDFGEIPAADDFSNFQDFVEWHQEIVIYYTEAPAPKDDPCSKENKAAGVAATALAKDPGISPAFTALSQNMTNNTTPNEQGFYITGTQASDIQTGSSPGSISLDIPGNVNPSHDVHSHPGSSPPSPGDIFEVGRMDATHTNFQGTFVVGADGSEYYVGVADAAQLKTFTDTKATNFDPVTGEFAQGTKIYEDYRDAYESFYHSGGMSVHQAQTAAMAYVMEEHNTGLVLYKKDSNGNFKPVSSIKDLDSQYHDVFKIEICF